MPSPTCSCPGPEPEHSKPIVRQKLFALQSNTFYVTQKGKPEEPFFYDDACYSVFLNSMFNCLKAYRIQLHSYVLLPHQVHWLMSPFSLAGLRQLIDRVNANYENYFGIRFDRNSTMIASSSAFLQLREEKMVIDFQKYIELIPVREQLVNMPGEYPWSAYCVNAFGGHKQPLVGHRQYRKLCANSGNPFQCYRNFVASSFSPAHYRQLENSLKHSEIDEGLKHQLRGMPSASLPSFPLSRVDGKAVTS